MKKHLQNLLLLVALLPFSGLNAQQVRYLDEVFSSVTVDSNIVYGKNKGFLTGFNVLENLKMDIYRPVGDTATSRPVIILMHAGSFLPGSVTGFTFADKNQNCIVEMCKRFAKRGYVAVSMSYRLGWSPTAPDQDTRSKTIINAVARAMQDSKNCLRYFRSTHADSSNKWGIDPNKFVLGGTNSGAYVALAASNLNKPYELQISKLLDINGNPFVDTLLTGNFDGFGGSQNVDNFPGYSSAFNAVLSLGGAVADTSFVEVGETPVIAFQGVNETLTPYNTAVVVTTTLSPVIEVSGSGDFMAVVDKLGNNDALKPNDFSPGPPNKQGGVTTTSIEGLYPFYGQGFEPWSWYNGTNPSINPGANQAKALLYIDTIMGYSLPRLYKLLIDADYGTPSSVGEVAGNVEMNMFPNPASSMVQVQVNSLQKPIETIRIMDLTGREVRQVTGINEHYHQLQVRELATGAYVVQIKLTDGQWANRMLMIER